MSNYKYEVAANNEIKIWQLVENEPAEAPFLFQPTWPDNTPWASKEEATAWAELFIESLENPESALIPGDSPEAPTKPRPVAESD